MQNMFKFQVFQGFLEIFVENSSILGILTALLITKVQTLINIT